MSRPWIFGIVCCCLLASSTSVGLGQAYLDLPEEDEPSSLTDKFLSLKDKFRRDKSPAKQPTTSSTRRAPTGKTKPHSPRYRSTSKSTSQRAHRNASGQQPPQSVAPNSKRSKTESRPKSANLLSASKLFSQGNSSTSQTVKRKAKQLTRATTFPRAGSSKPKPSTPRVARKSPSTSRANELDAALADLLKPQAKPSRVPKVTRSAVSKARKSSKLSSTLAGNTFDLRQVLLDDDEDSIAAEIAEAAAPAPQVEPESKVAKTKEVEAPVEATVVKGPVEEVQPEVQSEVELPVPELVVPKPVVVEASIETQPVVEPTLQRPIISLATPPRKPTVPVLTQQKVTNDPFESAAKQVFSTPPQSHNPMRSFLPANEQQKPGETHVQPQRRVLQTSQQPVIVSHVEGPQSILVGREATYQVTLENTSSSPASNLSAEITVPEWAELVDAMSTSGMVERRRQGSNEGAIEWKLSELAPNSSQALRLRLIPHSGRPLQLGVRWSQAPMQSQTIVEVQEPKLELMISGPKEVRFGQPQRYRLTLRNPGTGLTEQVMLRLVPPGGDPQAASTQEIGDLKPGEVRDLDLELTAREAGELLIQASAASKGGLKVETTKAVLCRKPELKVDWRGPDKKYAGTVAAYYFRIRNPGTTATEPVDVSVKLPAGAEFVGASEGYSINSTTGVVSWRLAAIDVNEEQFAQLRCKIARPGMNDFEVRAKTSDGELTDSKAFQTEVVALADLQLEVTDPQGPLPLGESVVYEIRVRNRGTTDAEGINIVGLFSEGIEPTTVEGAQFTLRDGRVSFHPIKNLPAGREVLLRIHAKANQVGTHIFRSEVSCPKLDIKLAAEETTRFFEDTHRWEDGQTPYSAERETSMNR